jgi:pyruvate formate lyase activating enzyme
MKGIVTEIERFSLKDGPGIRTTVFLKGCNMRCAWCHNPETLSLRPQLLWYPEKCIGCGACTQVCPTGARSKDDAGGLSLQPEKCNSCGRCANECFSGALVLSGKEMTVEEVMEEIRQDLPYYRNSGGGVTLSGGEVAVQPQFALALLQALHREGISTALETNMLAPWEVYEPLLKETDLLMFDIKLFQDQLHKKWTGVSNQSILENSAKAAKMLPYLVRTPVIPGVNDNPEEIGSIARFLSGLGGEMLYYELLRFNPLGESKYRALAMDNCFSGVRPGSEEDTEKLADCARAQGLKEVRIG